MRRSRFYLLINIKHLTLTQYEIATDDFGKVFVKYSQPLIDLFECKRYVNPEKYFIIKAGELLLQHEGWEVLTGSSVDRIFEAYNNMQ